MVASRLKRNLQLLKFLKKAKKQKRSAFLKTAPNDLIVCICDCANNILRGSVHLKSKDKKALQRHKKALRALVKRREGVGKKRKFLIQKGGFLPFLLSPIISAAGSILGSLLGPRQS